MPEAEVADRLSGICEEVGVCQSESRLKEVKVEITREELDRVAEKAAVSAATLTAEQLAREEEERLHHSPISPHCEDVLAKPPLCYDFRGIRAFVMCKAWDIMDKEKRTRLPVGEAWIEARKTCRME